MRRGAEEKHLLINRRYPQLDNISCADDNFLIFLNCVQSLLSETSFDDNTYYFNGRKK